MKLLGYPGYFCARWWSGNDGMTKEGKIMSVALNPWIWWWWWYMMSDFLSLNALSLVWSKKKKNRPLKAFKPKSPDEMERGDGGSADDRTDNNDEGGNYFDQFGWDLTGGDDIPCGAQVCHFSNAPFGRFLSPHQCPSSNIYKRAGSQNTDKKPCSLPISF